MKKFKKVLLVDDDLASNVIGQAMIEDMDLAHQIYIAKHGEEALRIIKIIQEETSHCPELILLDINMPVMDGFEFLEEFNKIECFRHQEIKIIMLTSSANPKDLERAKNYNIVSYLQKPITEKELLLAIARE